MKKLIKTIIAISLLTMVLTSCSSDSAEVENVDSTQNQAEQSETDNNENDVVDAILYENADLGFSMHIPLSWEGKYTTKDFENTYEDGVTIQTVIFSHNATMNELDSESGWLFSFGKITGEQFTKEEPPVMTGNCIILEQAGGYTYFVSFPSGVEYNEDPGSESAAEYKAMQGEVDFLIDTFELIEK